jgi:hypothetical protein
LRGLAERVIDLHRALDRAGIAHAFGGAIAYAYHSEPRATRDIDLNVFLPAHQPTAALDVMATLGITVLPEEDAERVRRDAQVRLRWGPVPVDLFFSALDFHDACQARVQRVPFGGVEIPILAAEDLAVCKVAFDRDKDWIDLGEMIAIQGEGFDGDYAASWLDRLLGADDRRTLRFRSLLIHPR